MSIRKTALLVMVLLLLFLVPALAGDVPPSATANIGDCTGKTIILHTNDVHGVIDGYARVAKLASDFREKGAEVILADAGDYTQGEIYVSTNKGHAAIEMMNAAGYDVATLGNHEFDFGIDQMLGNLKVASFQTVCANVYRNGALILPASTIIETGAGLKLGFFGLVAPETATKVNPGMIEGVEFSTFDKLYADAQAAVDDLRAHGADLVIGLWHLGVDDESGVDGYRSTDVYDRVSGVDFVIDGHAHTVMTRGPGGEPIQSTGTKFENIGIVVIDDATKTIEDNYLVSTAKLAKAPDVDAVAQAIIKAVNTQFGAPFAVSEVRLNGERAPGTRTGETNLGDLIVDAMVWSVVRNNGIGHVDASDVVGITNGGGIRNSIEAGDVSMKDINTALPFGNTVAVIYVTGQELLECLEASTFCTPDPIGGFPQTSGIDWTIDTTVPYDRGELYIKHDGGQSTYYAPASISRVTIHAVNGAPFDPDGIYAVVTNDFCAEGGDTYNVFMRSAYAGTGFDTGIPLDQAVMEYISTVLKGKITEEAYGQPRGSLTIIRAED